MFYEVVDNNDFSYLLSTIFLSTGIDKIVIKKGRIKNILALEYKSW